MILSPTTKLEFSNPEHIAELRRQAELEESDTWQMEMEISGSITVTIEGAKNQEEAREIAYQKYLDELLECVDVEFYSVRRVLPKKEIKKEVSMNMFPSMFAGGVTE